MTPEEKQIANDVYRVQQEQRTTIAKAYMVHDGYCWVASDGERNYELPDYLNDLNAKVLVRMRPDFGRCRHGARQG